ncbi:MAG: ABC transporter ATP-binding protein [Geminicoccaceae bacterium]|nr:ABC transporter ATP-binding protein [Geminicoccaceae bacterium]
MRILEAQGLIGGYGAMDILKGVDLFAEAGRLGVVVGPNGAGKSTALKAVLGMLELRAGSITFEGESLGGLSTSARIARGIGAVPQNDNIFQGMTVLENLEMGGYLVESPLAPRIERMFAIFPPLAEKRRQPAGELSGGQRQMVAMARALMAEPRLLLLDEPTAGLSPAFRADIFARIRTITEEGVAVLMVEQNAREALAIADTGFVLAAGANRFTGSGAELVADPDVRAAFLGG